MFDGTIYWHRHLTAFQGEIRTLKSTVSDLSGRLWKELRSCVLCGLLCGFCAFGEGSDFRI